MSALHRVACVIGLCLVSGLLHAAEPVVCVTEEGQPTFEHCERHVAAVKSQDLTRYAGRPVPRAVVQENIRAAKWQDYTEQRCHGDSDCLNRIYSREQAIAAKFDELGIALHDVVVNCRVLCVEINAVACNLSCLNSISAP